MYAQFVAKLSISENTLFLGFQTKNHRQRSVLKLEKPLGNNRSQWLTKKNRTDCDGNKWPKTSTSHRCYKKNIGIASLSKIDHRSSLVLNANVASILGYAMYLILQVSQIAYYIFSSGICDVYVTPC